MSFLKPEDTKDWYLPGTLPKRIRIGKRLRSLNFDSKAFFFASFARVYMRLKLLSISCRALQSRTPLSLSFCSLKNGGVPCTTLLDLIFFSWSRSVILFVAASRSVDNP